MSVQDIAKKNGFVAQVNAAVARRRGTRVAAHRVQADIVVKLSKHGTLEWLAKPSVLVVLQENGFINGSLSFPAKTSLAMKHAQLNKLMTFAARVHAGVLFEADEEQIAFIVSRKYKNLLLLSDAVIAKADEDSRFSDALEEALGGTPESFGDEDRAREEEDRA
jgi:hypothetical protein